LYRYGEVLKNVNVAQEGYNQVQNSISTYHSWSVEVCGKSVRKWAFFGDSFVYSGAYALLFTKGMNAPLSKLTIFYCLLAHFGRKK
jgi:hypothetical protein